MGKGCATPQEVRFFVARFLSLARLSRASFFSKSSFETLRTMLSALPIRSDGVSPGTCGAAGNGFIFSLSEPNDGVRYGISCLDSGFVLTQEGNRVMCFLAMSR